VIRYPQFINSLALLLACSACYSSDGARTNGSDGSLSELNHDAGIDPLEDGSLFSIEQTLDSLTASQAKKVCEQAVQRVDPCRVYAANSGF
jgi:hypothetical protein